MATELKHIPLHVHTEFSLLDGASRLPDICKKAKETGMPALALTDHGTMYGVYQFFHEAKKNDIKPIIGCEVYIVDGDHREKGKRTKLFHLVMLAKNDTGYKNLIKIVSEGCINGFYYKPRISKDYIRERSEGIIALSACLGGEVNNLLLNNKDEEAREAALEYKEIFGEDFYLEIQDHLYPEDRHVNPKVIAMGKELGIKVVATNDSHYTNKEDAIAHDALLCLQMQKYIADFPRMRFSGHEHLKTGEEMLSLFRDHLPEDVINQVVLENPSEIMEKIEGYEAFENPQMHMPDPKIPEGHSFETYLRELSYQGAKLRFRDELNTELDTSVMSKDELYKLPDEVLSKEVIERLDVELEIMNGSGFASYFIVVWDFIDWARNNDIPVGPGRGSAAGSLVAFCLGITNIDPLKYDLLFERFLNPERKSMPDIDTDFCIERREDVINYVREKYGEDNVCQIITFNRLTSRSVIKDMARVLEYPYAKAEELAKMIPVVRGKPRSIEWMIENHSEFGEKYKRDPEVRQVLDLAMKNEGINKTFGVHAAGVIISDVPVTDVIPTSKNNDGSIITQFAMEEAANMGLLKMDFLGLRNLTMIKKAIDIIHDNQLQEALENDPEISTLEEAKAKIPRIDIDAVPLDDRATYDTVCSGNLAGIFQLESSGMKQVARDLAPDNMEDISALIALYRPGPLDTGMIDDFIARKKGTQKIVYDHKLLEGILDKTYGTIVYQEQIMLIAQVLGGFSLGEADLLRRAMGKKKPEVLLPFKDRFLDGCEKNEISRAVGEKLFEQMIAFAEYCFNKSHSTAYGFVTYQTAYLKTHYPVEYLTSLFMSCNGDTDKIKFYIIEAERLGIKVAPPNVNESGLDFTAKVKDKTIVFGLSAIKGVGAAPVESMLAEREANGPFKDFFDFCKRIDPKVVNKRTIEGLIKSGALDSLASGQKVGRKAMVENLERFIQSAKKKREEEEKGQTNLFALMGASEEGDDSSAGIVGAPNYIEGPEDEYPERELQSMEYELLGLFVSNHPMLALKGLTKVITEHSIKSFEDFKDTKKVKFTALITNFVKKITKSKKLIAILDLEDPQGRVEGVLFSKKLEMFEHLLEKGNRVLVEGTLSKHSEGDCSVLVDSLKDLEGLGTVDIEIDISMIEDHFRFFHALRSFATQEQNKGGSIVLLTLKDGAETRRLSMGDKNAVANTDFVRNGFQDIVKKFSVKPMPMAA